MIGTMRAVDDGKTNKITSTFYGYISWTSLSVLTILAHDAAFALNKTMNSALHVPFDQWIIYIHLGAWSSYIFVAFSLHVARTRCVQI